MDSSQLERKLTALQGNRSTLQSQMMKVDAEIAEVAAHLRAAVRETVREDLGGVRKKAKVEKAVGGKKAKTKKTKKIASSSSSSSSSSEDSEEEEAAVAEEVVEEVAVAGGSSSRGGGVGGGVGDGGEEGGGGGGEEEGGEEGGDGGGGGDVGGEEGGDGERGEEVGAEGEGAEGEGAGGGGAAGAAAAEHVLLTRELFAGFSCFKDMPSGSCSACWRRGHPPANQGTHLRIEGRCLLFGVISVRGRPKKAM